MVARRQSNTGTEDSDHARPGPSSLSPAFLCTVTAWTNPLVLPARLCGAAAPRSYGSVSDRGPPSTRDEPERTQQRWASVSERKIWTNHLVLLARLSGAAAGNCAHRYISKVCCRQSAEARRRVQFSPRKMEILFYRCIRCMLFRSKKNFGVAALNAQTPKFLFRPKENAPAHKRSIPNGRISNRHIKISSLSFVFVSQ